MDLTTLGLKKPLITESYDLKIVNDNADKVNELITADREQINNLGAYAVASGTNNYTATIIGYTLIEGQSVKIKFTNANTGASTLNINGLGAKAIQKGNGSALTNGNIKAGQICNLVYTGSVFQLLGEGGEYGTATAFDVLSGKTIGTDNGLVEGTIPIKGSDTITPSTIAQSISAGQYLSGTQTIVGDADLISANIKSGANIFGVAGNSNVVDTADATIPSAAYMYSGVTAYKNGAKLTGTMPLRGTTSVTLTTQGSAHTVPYGYHDGGTVTASLANLTAGNIKSGVNVGGVVGTLEEATIPLISDLNCFAYDSYRIGAKGYEVVTPHPFTTNKFMFLLTVFTGRTTTFTADKPFAVIINNKTPEYSTSYVNTQASNISGTFIIFNPRKANITISTSIATNTSVYTLIN